MANRNTSDVIIEMANKKLRLGSAVSIHLGELPHQTLTAIRKYLMCEKEAFGYYRFEKLAQKKVAGLQAIE